MSTKTTYNVVGKIEYYPKLFAIPKIVEINFNVKAYNEKDATKKADISLSAKFENSGGVISDTSQLKIRKAESDG